MIRPMPVDRWDSNQELFRRVLEKSAAPPSEIPNRSPFYEAEKGQDAFHDVLLVMNQSVITQKEAWEMNRVDETVLPCRDIRPNLFQHTLTEASSGKTVLQVPPDYELKRIRGIMELWQRGFELLGRYLDIPA